MNPKEMGLVTKINGLPREMINDCLNAFSSIGARISARINGAGSYLNFFIRYPISPKKIKNPTSTML